MYMYICVCVYRHTHTYTHTYTTIQDGVRSKGVYIFLETHPRNIVFAKSFDKHAYTDTLTQIYTLCFSKWLPWSWGQKGTGIRWRNSSCHSTHVHNDRDRDRDRDTDTHLHTLPFRVASVVMGSIKIWNALAQFLTSFDTPLRCPSILADCRRTIRLIVAASARLHTHTNTHICIHIYTHVRHI